MTFQDLNLGAQVLKALAHLGYEEPTPIQAEAIPSVISGVDVMAQAQTGTGKTAAFALPLLTKIDLEDVSPQVLVICPTRELAVQVAESFQKYAANLPGFHVLSVYGGQEYRVQLRALKRGTHVIVGTPGRIKDHIQRGTLKLGNIRSVVLDEGDEMLNMGFVDDIETILGELPDERQTLIFSATFPKEIKRIAAQYQKNPEQIHIKEKTEVVEMIRQTYCLIHNNDKLVALTRFLEVEDVDAAIIFVRTKLETNELSDKLLARGHSVACINGDMKQSVREDVIRAVKSGKIDILIATDVAARGLDVPRITHVVNYDIPYDVSSYVHRIGRTGRAGKKGTALLLVTPREMRMFHSIESHTRQKLEELLVPTSNVIREKRLSELCDKIDEQLGLEHLERYQTLVSELLRDTELSAQDLSAALLGIINQHRPFDVQDLKPIQRPKLNSSGRRTYRGKGPSKFEGSKSGRSNNYKGSSDRRFKKGAGRGK